MTTVVCLPHRQPACLICNPEPPKAVAEQRRNAWLRDGHTNVTAAKQHRTDMVAAWQAQSLSSWIAGKR